MQATAVSFKSRLRRIRRASHHTWIAVTDMLDDDNMMIILAFLAYLATHTTFDGWLYWVAWPMIQRRLDIYGRILVFLESNALPSEFLADGSIGLLSTSMYHRLEVRQLCTSGPTLCLRDPLRPFTLRYIIHDLFPAQPESVLLMRSKCFPHSRLAGLRSSGHRFISS